VSVLQDAIIKLKTAGFAAPPDPSIIQQMPGLGPDEKIALLQAARTGNLNQIWGPVGNNNSSAAQSQIPAAARQVSAPMPTAAVQQRDTQSRDRSWEEAAPPPGGGPSRAAADYGPNYKAPENPGWSPYWLDPAAAREIGTGVANAVIKNAGTPTPGGGLPVPVPVNKPPAIPATVPDSTRNSQIPTAPTSIDALPDWRKNGYDPRRQKAGGASVPDSTRESQIPDAPDTPVPTAPTAPDYIPLSLPDYSSLSMPGPIDFKFVNRDFTKQGQKLAKEAWAPQYEALEGVKQDTTDRYNTSDVVMKEMYNRLVDELKGQRTEDDARYAKQVADINAAAPEAQARTAANYDSSASIMNKILQNTGDASTKNSPQAALIAAEMAKERAAALGNDQGSSEARVDNTTDRKNSQNAYDTSLIDANREQGVASREGLLRQLHQSMSGYDQQALGYKSEERQAALQLADQLFGRDQDFQQREYGQLQDANQNAWNQYNAGVNQINGTNQVANQNTSNQNSLAQSQYGTDTDNYWRQVEMDYKKTQDALNRQLDIAKIQASANGNAGSLDNLGPMGVIKQQIINDSPGATADQVNAAFSQAMSLYGNVKDDNYRDANQFIYTVITKNPQIPQEVARAAAMAVWAGMLKINEPPKAAI